MGNLDSIPGLGRSPGGGNGGFFLYLLAIRKPLSFLISDQTCFPCIARQVLNHRPPGKSQQCILYEAIFKGLPGGLDGKESACNAGDTGSIFASGRSSGERNGYLLQYSWGIPGGSDGKESACNVGDLGLSPGSGRTTGEGNGNLTPVFLPGEFTKFKNRHA